MDQPDAKLPKRMKSYLPAHVKAVLLMGEKSGDVKMNAWGDEGPNLVRLGIMKDASEKVRKEMGKTLSNSPDEEIDSPDEKTEKIFGPMTFQEAATKAASLFNITEKEVINTIASKMGIYNGLQVGKKLSITWEVHVLDNGRINVCKPESGSFYILKMGEVVQKNPKTKEKEVKKVLTVDTFRGSTLQLQTSQKQNQATDPVQYEQGQRNEDE